MAWKALTTDEKLDRLRESVIELAELVSQIDQIVGKLSRHTHAGGQVVAPVFWRPAVNRRITSAYLGDEEPAG